MTSPLDIVRKATCGNTGLTVPDLSALEAKKEGTDRSGMPLCDCKSCRQIHERNKRLLGDSWE
jgi:hypothetical protein